MKITILWASLAGYSVAFFKTLRTYYGWEIQLIYQPPNQEAPYDQFDLSFCNESFEDSPEIKLTLEELCVKFEPICVLISSWAYPHYMRTAKKLRHCGSYVVSVMDNQWRSTLKQWIGIFTSRWFLKPSIDSFFVAGDRQASFARKLGYEDLMYGCYAADIDTFSCEIPLRSRAQNFIFIGRLNDIKGIDILIDAYYVYRDRVKNPWGLIVAGTGKMAAMIESIPEIHYLGFVSPNRLPHTLQMARCLILPSRFEPWGVAIHEACAAGLPIIATYLCGATTTFVRDGINGYIIPPKIKNLVKAMSFISELSDRELVSMGDVSLKLSSLWSPKLLADYFCTNVKRNCKNRNFFAPD